MSVVLHNNLHFDGTLATPRDPPRRRSSIDWCHTHRVGNVQLMKFSIEIVTRREYRFQTRLSNRWEKQKCCNGGVTEFEIVNSEMHFMRATISCRDILHGNVIRLHLI